MKKYIIAGFAGIGKTTLANKNPNDVIDMEIRLYKYKNYKPEYSLPQWYSMEHIENEGFLEEYFKAIKDEIENGTHKIIFVWLKTEVLDWMIKEKINFFMAFWDKDEEGIKQFLTDRYMQRGNPQYWIDKVLKYMDVINEYAENNNIPSIILHKNENIEEILKNKLKLL